MQNSYIEKPEVADIVRRFQSDYTKKYGTGILPSWKKALSDIANCQTAAMGGRLMRCSACKQTFWIYHSCRNRSCPKCHGAQIKEWLEKTEASLLPCPYFHLIATVPSELHQLFLKHQKEFYGLLMKTVAQVTIDLCRNPKYMGATPAVMGVLHTWNGRLLFHPHVHLLVSGGGMDSDNKWRQSHQSFLIPVRALSRIVAARFRDYVKQHYPNEFIRLGKKVWRKNWCSFCVSYGTGQKAVLNYLGRYVFRIAITKNRIVSMTDQTVTFRYKDRKRNVMKEEIVSGIEFLRRFLLHVLPRSFHKVRYYGLWHASQRENQDRVRKELGEESPDEESKRYGEVCPHCGAEHPVLIMEFKRDTFRYHIRAPCR